MAIVPKGVTRQAEKKAAVKVEVTEAVAREETTVEAACEAGRARVARAAATWVTMTEEVRAAVMKMMAELEVVQLRWQSRWWRRRWRGWWG